MMNRIHTLLAVFILTLLPAACRLAAAEPLIEARPHVDGTITRSGYQDEFHQALYERLNEIRRTFGLPEVLVSPDLDAAAKAHADDMLRRSYFEHASPEGETHEGRVHRLRPRAIAFDLRENLAWSKSRGKTWQDRVFSTYKGWMESPGHKENLLNTTSTHVGFGIARETLPNGAVEEYIVQVFGIVAGRFEETPPAAISRRSGPWRAKIVLPAEFYLADETNSKSKYPDPWDDRRYWVGGTPLVLERRYDQYFLNFPALNPGSYELRARLPAHPGFFALKELRVH